MSGLAIPGEISSPSTTVPSTAANARMWWRTRDSQSSHQRVTSHSVPTNMANRKHRNNAPYPDSSRALDAMLTASNSVSRSR
jgi:hypothetical protein